MFYHSFEDSGLKHDPFKAMIVPRPIGWISTINEDGRPNLAPYSFFNIISVRPHLIAFASHELKHSAANAQATGEFVYNMVSAHLMDLMLQTSEDVDVEINEFECAGIAMLPSKIVSPPRVADSPVALECRVVNVMQLKDVEGRELDRYLTIGQVVGVHLDDRHLQDGIFDVASAQPVGRCGYHDYTKVSELICV
ncbi:flavin reductase (DIM6/NTAB) family NADH-FMN oxidoreductase RutF [Rhodoligotrophos appendicifer]|uniref:flavin reductase family protein n=1 Tax=Rhodoligotrophos appendicifer TaxID=987056 RepID=UPI001184F540|nr:flavin reductase family protein [Rhodoligotrophos appendicifer]